MEPRRRQIMAATEQLIAEQGFDAFRLRDVADRAQVSVGMIQHYFDTRDGLALETVSSTTWRRAEEWSSLVQGVTDPVARTRLLLDGSLSDAARCRAWMETCSAATRHAELLPMIARIYQAWREALGDALQAGIDEGVFAPVVPLDQVLDTIMAMIDGLMVAVGMQVYEVEPPYFARILTATAEGLLGHRFTLAVDES
ncbi:hypothetical protein BH10ACT10_BH10ACT10_04410 [soil metagenome]